MIELLQDPETYASLVALTAMEIVLGIDNIVFISILTDKLPPAQRPKAPVQYYYVECPACGYEPEEQLVLPRFPCPKCHCDSWQRRKRPGSLVPPAVASRSRRTG